VTTTEPAPIRGLLAALAAGLLAACGGAKDVPLPGGAFLIEDRALSEMSGLEASPAQPGVLWAINDSGSLPRLYRLGHRGEDRGRVWILGAWVSDSETLAFYRDGATDWLLIGDVGDNRARRGSVRVHAVKEPGPDARVARVAWTLRFRYPDGPRDAEGIAVDHLHDDLLVISKRDRHPRLYRVPLAARHARAVAIAEPVAELSPDWLEGEVTGLDLSKDGTQLAVLTYRGLYLWTREPGQDWSTVVADPPRALPMPKLRKAEAMAFSADHSTLYVGSEKRPAPLVRIPLD
jgi:hypothetical protein